MELHGRATTRLRYRFNTIAQARAHLKAADGGWLFFYREQKLRLLPHAPVCLELGFEDGGEPCILRGQVQAAVEDTGIWLEIFDPSPLQTQAEFTRASRRVGCELPVAVRSEGSLGTGSLLDLSTGGARVAFTGPLSPGQPLELRLLSPDGLTFRDLAFGQVAWADRGEVGVRFDPADSIGRAAVTRLLREVSAHWRRAWEARHPHFCCKAEGVAEPEPPRLRRPGDVGSQIAL